MDNQVRTELLAALRKLRDEGPRHSDRGICNNIPTWAKLYLRPLWERWPHYVRVRDAYVAANGRVALPADLVDAPVRLPSTLAVAGAERCRVATLDLERVIRGVETTAELPAQLHTAHEDLDRAFESVFTKAALTYFRTGILEQDHV